MADVEAFAKAVAEKHAKLDVLINNAGVYRVAEIVSQDGLDTRSSKQVHFRMRKNLLMNWFLPTVADKSQSSRARICK
jgi:short-subunit dehydrogenase involved in D-alanine esterification of teichoic acids